MTMVRQRGQSMTEFIVALAVLFPLYLAVQYAGRYGDILQTTQQASRYAAFQRAMQPDTGVLSDDTIRNQMRARFFARWDAQHKGKLQSDDSATGLKDKAQSAVWRDLRGKALLAKMDDVELTWKDAAINSGAVGGAMDVLTTTAGKSWNPGRVAQVEVTLANKLDLLNPKPAPFKLAGATAAAGDALSSSGSKATRDAAATLNPGVALSSISSVIDLFVMLFEPSGPELGCIKPDIVPLDRLDKPQGAQGCL